MDVIVWAADAPAALAHLTAAGETVHQIGEIRARQAGEAQTIVV
jgi:phosphoribosylformylglycinamidine cyclo-ligase